MKISNSEIKTYQECKRKWWFQYYLHLTKKSNGTEKVNNLTFGSKIHAALQAWYVSGGQEDPVVVMKKLFISERLEIEQANDAELLKKFNEQEKMGNLLIGHYMDKVKNEGLDYGFKYISSEEEYEMELIEDVSFIGKIDALMEREIDGSKFLLEHKSYASSNASQNLKIAHIEPQHIGYMLLYQANNDDRLVGTILNIIRKLKTLTRSKDPIIIREIIRHNQLEIDNYFIRLQEIAKDIKTLKEKIDVEGHKVAYPNPTTDCSWRCDFFSVCHMIDDGSNWEKMLEANYEEYDPYERYEDIEQ
jgi:hypothetical protein